MGSLAHRNLATMANSLGCTRLMSFSLGFTPVIISSHPETAKEILTSPSFSDRPIKASARLLMFERAIGFAPHGSYWRNLRRLCASHMFSPRRISNLEEVRETLAKNMLENVVKNMDNRGVVELRGLLQEVSLKNMLETVFGSNLGSERVGEELGFMVREGYELISKFNLEDYFNLGFLDFNGVKRRCHKLACKVNQVLGEIIKVRKKDEELNHSDMVAVLWV